MDTHCKQLRTLVIDDEPLARDALVALLEGDADIATIDEAADVEEALRKVREIQPQLIFLDVKMPGGDGFSLLQHLETQSAPAVIFVTAFDDYAIPAFDANAVDYLLKPVTSERFQKAVVRAKSRIADRPRYLQRVAVRVGEGIRLVQIEDVEWLEAQENYVRVYAERKVFLLHATLNRLIESLDPQRFVRVHRSAAVKIDSIREAHGLNAGEYVLTLASGAQVRTGRTYRDAVRALLSNFC